MSADRADLRERVASYRDLAGLAASQGMTELAAHAAGLATRYQAELDARLALTMHIEPGSIRIHATTYDVPTDPADATNCEACQ